MSVRRALRSYPASDPHGTNPIDPPDGGPDWDWWERDLLPPDPHGGNSKRLSKDRELLPLR